MSKQPIFLFLHGAGGTASKWRRVRETFDRPALFIDLPGHGTNRSPIPGSIEEYADTLNETYGDQELIVVGHSMGGMIGMEMAARNKNVKGLVLATSHYRLPVHPHILVELRRGKFPEWFFYASYTKEADPELINQEKVELAYNPLHVTLSDFEACNRYNGKEALVGLDIPILAVYGTKDKLVPREASEQLLALHPRVQIEKIEGGSHYVILEQPDLFVQALKKLDPCL